MDKTVRSAGAMNFREALHKNQRHTQYVIVLFLMIYTLIGLLLDVFRLSYQYPHESYSVFFQAFLHGYVVPWCMLGMIFVGIVSVLIAYTAYDKIMLMGLEYHEVTPETATTLQEKKLLNVLQEMTISASLGYTPRLFIVDAPYMNAFASGYSEKSAMIAVTKPLMDACDRSELQAVIAHELSHIRHLDIKLTLMISILSNLLLIAIEIAFRATFFRGDSERRDNRFLFIFYALRFILPAITMILMLFLSRTREYMADAGAVQLMRDNTPMIRALLKIQQHTEEHQDEVNAFYANTPHEGVRQSAYLFEPKSLSASSFSQWFSTHPSLEQRLEALGYTEKL